MQSLKIVIATVFILSLSACAPLNEMWDSMTGQSSVDQMQNPDGSQMQEYNHISSGGSQIGTHTPTSQRTSEKKKKNARPTEYYSLPDSVDSAQHHDETAQHSEATE